MKVLVMGGTGFIGKNICQLLDENKVEYDVYSNNLNSEKNHFFGNILEDKKFENIIKGYDSIVYLIASGFSQAFLSKPSETYKEEISSMIKTLDCCVKNNVKRVVFASSGGTVYGSGNGVKQKETDLPNPMNHYGICKLTNEKILLLYNELYGMENICLRVANPYGKGQNVSSGVGLITTVINKILNDEEIIVFGDGKTVRDYIDIKTVAEAFYSAIKWDFDKKILPVFNVGSGQELSVNDIIKIVQDSLEKEGKLIYKEKRPFDVEYSCLDLEKTKEILGIKIENQEDMIKQYASSYKKEKGRVL